MNIKIRCRNCKMIKNTIFRSDIGSDDPPILEHWDQISKCCQSPDYRWYNSKSKLLDILDSQFGAELGHALVNELPEIFKILAENLGSKKIEEWTNQKGTDLLQRDCLKFLLDDIEDDIEVEKSQRQHITL